MAPTARSRRLLPRPGNFLAADADDAAQAAGTRVFWYLFATFFICGFTTNGLVGTHLIAFCGDMGIPEVQAAGLLAMMGVFDLIGTTLSGWLTDRFDPRKLLGVYYGVRGLSLIYLPLLRLLGDQPDAVCRALRARLDRHGAADAAAQQRSVRRPQRAAGVRLDRRRASGRRGGGGVLRWRHAGNPGRLCSSPSMIAGMTAIIAAALSLLIEKDHRENALRGAQAA